MTLTTAALSVGPIGPEAAGDVPGEPAAAGLSLGAVSRLWLGLGLGPPAAGSVRAGLGIPLASDARIPGVGPRNSPMTAAATRIAATPTATRPLSRRWTAGGPIATSSMNGPSVA